VLYVLAIPDRLKQTIREAKGQNILGGLLAEEMVDSKDLRLCE
jgi:hypothetical protein